MRRLLAVLGSDVSRSLSPFLHGRAAAELGLDLAYVPVSTPDLDRAIDALIALGALGANVTQPYKRRALARASTATDIARAIGAANTLTFGPGGAIHADNTDGPALLGIFQSYPPEALDAVHVLGAGGAACAVVWALEKAGARSVIVAARDPARSLLPGVVPLAARRGSLVVSTLPGDPAIAQRAIDWVDAPLVLDLSYGTPDVPSPLTALARARGFQADDGLAMLIAQAALSLAAWSGLDFAVIHASMARGFDSKASRA